MGYYSEYKIETTPDLFTDVDIDTFTEELEEISGGYGFDFWGDAFRTEGKWYSWKEHITALSLRHRLLEITVEQIGEDGEGTKLTFKNGEIVKRYRRGWEEV